MDALATFPAMRLNPFAVPDNTGSSMALECSVAVVAGSLVLILRVRIHILEHGLGVEKPFIHLNVCRVQTGCG